MQRTRRQILTTALACLVLLGLTAPLHADDTSGFLYGRVTTESGSTFEGRLRWGTEEAFWGDLFNSVKAERMMPKEARNRDRKRERIRVFGITVGVRWSDVDGSRTLKARFGDIREIQVRGGDRATLVMKSGTEVDIDGGSNDVGAKVRVWDAALGKVEVEWKKIDTIEFLPTPRGLEVDAFRLHGTVQTSEGDFTGYIQWDQDECLSTDKLDGDTRDADLSLEMGSIRRIERRSSSSSRVTLRDGREFVLEGSNDVNSENRGIFVEDDRYGRVLVHWDEFESVDFSEAGDSGPAYADFKQQAALRGAVTDEDGATYRGKIVHDLDEAEGWEFFDGNWRGIEYLIPMAMIRSIVPRTSDSCDVVLVNGEELELEDTADTGDGNSGVLILEDENRKTYVPWEEVSRLQFER